MMRALEKAQELSVLAEDAGGHRESVEIRSRQRLAAVRIRKSLEGDGKVLPFVGLAAARERVLWQLGSGVPAFHPHRVYFESASPFPVRGGGDRVTSGLSRR